MTPAQLVAASSEEPAAFENLLATNLEVAAAASATRVLWRQLATTKSEAEIYSSLVQITNDSTATDHNPASVLASYVADPEVCRHSTDLAAFDMYLVFFANDMYHNDEYLASVLDTPPRRATASQHLSNGTLCELSTRSSFVQALHDHGMPPFFRAALERLSQDARSSAFSSLVSARGGDATPKLKLSTRPVRPTLRRSAVRKGASAP